MKTEETNLEQSCQIDSYRRILDGAFFRIVASSKEQNGLIINAKLLDRDKSFLGNRLKISA